MNTDDYPEPRFCGYVGMPRALYLEAFAKYVRDIFHADVFLVGSALKTKEWHDLDVVVILSDEQWDQYGFGDPKDRFKNKSWIAYCMAISCLGKKLVGCDIDFQVHQASYSQIHKDDPRLLIG
jgi:hypothetical protein